MGQRLVLKSVFRRVAALLVALVLLCALFSPSVFAAEGKLGKVEWSLSGGVLTLSGKGAVPDFTELSPAPWAAHKAEITHLVVEKGVTALGNMAFFDFTQLASVQLPETVKTVGNMTFAGCEKLQGIDLSGVTALGEYAFSRCFALSSLRLSEGLTTIGAYAFYRCGGLRTLRVPSSVTQMGGSVFAYCDGLLSVEIAAPLTVLPEWTFYGCEDLQMLTVEGSLQSVGAQAFTRCTQLIYVYVDGSESQVETLLPTLLDAVPGLAESGVEPLPRELPTLTDREGEFSDGKMQETITQIESSAGGTVQTETTVIYPANSDYTYNDQQKQDAQIEIEADLTDASGWDAVLEQVEKQEIQQGILQRETGKDVPLTLRVNLLYGSVLLGKDLAALAGKDLILELCTVSGSRWQIRCAFLQGRKFKKQYDLNYGVSHYAEPSKSHKKVIGEAQSYWLTFADEIDFPAILQVQLRADLWLQTATLYESSWIDGLERLQSVQVSQKGVAAFAMGNVNKGKRYILALNVAGIPAAEVRLPQDEIPAVGSESWLENYVPVTEQYTITAVRGFGGMTMGQFTVAVVIGVVALAFVVFVVILVINFQSKKKALQQLREQQK